MLPSPETWFVAQTQAHRETRASAELTKQGFEVFLPYYRKQIRHARRVNVVNMPLFPGYIFVRLSTATRWRAVNGTLGVIRIVTCANEPAPVPNGVVEGLMSRCDADGYVPLPARDALKAGDRVRVAGGAFAETLGLFDDVRDGDRVAILIDLLGRKVRVLVDGALVEKAA